MNKNSILTFSAGLVTGAAVGVGGFYLYFRKTVKMIQEIADDQIEQMAQYYGKTDEYLRMDCSMPDYEEDTLSETMNGRGEGILSREQRIDIKEQQKKLRENWAGTTNYAKMYQSKDSESTLTSEDLDRLMAGVDPSELEHPEEAQNEQMTEEEQHHEEHLKNRNKKPKIISVEDAADLPGYIEEQTLYYYTEDEVLVDDNEEVIDDPEMLIGDALEKYGFAQNDERIIFVMNYALDTCYEVQKVEGSWNEED